MTDRFDDSDVVTLGDGYIRVQGEGGMFELVTGSRQISRTPRGYSQPDQEDRLARQQSTVITLDPNTRWCYVCGETRPLDYFRSDCARPSGVYPMCKACENELQRRRYADAKGGAVRPYRRKTS